MKCIFIIIETVPGIVKYWYNSMYFLHYKYFLKQQNGVYKATSTKREILPFPHPLKTFVKDVCLAIFFLSYQEHIFKS